MPRDPIVIWSATWVEIRSYTRVRPGDCWRPMGVINSHSLVITSRFGVVRTFYNANVLSKVRTNLMSSCKGFEPTSNPGRKSTAVEIWTIWVHATRGSMHLQRTVLNGRKAQRHSSQISDFWSPNVEEGEIREPDLKQSRETKRKHYITLRSWSHTPLTRR